jgi:hypothetical protein
MRARRPGPALLPNVSFVLKVATVPDADVLASSLKAYHAPVACRGPLTDVASAAGLGMAVNTLCVSSPCDGRGCNLTVALPQARQYVLTVRGLAQELWLDLELGAGVRLWVGLDVGGGSERRAGSAARRGQWRNV